MPIRRDMQTAVEESECSTAVRGWLLAMSAAVNAATAAALHRIRAGKVLAVLELALRKIDEEVLGRDGSSRTAAEPRNPAAGDSRRFPAGESCVPIPCGRLTLGPPKPGPGVR